MRTIRSALLHPDSPPGPAPADDADSGMENLTDSVIDFRLSKLTAAAGPAHPEAVVKSSSANAAATEMLDLSRGFSDYSSFNSDISWELKRLAAAAAAPRSDAPGPPGAVNLNDLESMDLSQDAALLERVEPFVLACVQALGPNAAPDARRAAAARIRLLAKHRSDIRELVGMSGAIPALVPLLRSTDPVAQNRDHIRAQPCKAATMPAAAPWLDPQLSSPTDAPPPFLGRPPLLSLGCRSALIAHTKRQAPPPSFN